MIYKKVIFFLLAGFITLSFQAEDLVRSATGELLQAEQSAFMQLDFTYNINSDYIIETTASGGVVSTVANFATLSTTTTSGSTALMQSKLPLRFYPGQGHACVVGALFGTPDANNEQLVGIGTTTDGFFFGYDYDTVNSVVKFGVMHRFDGTDTWVYQDDWNQDRLDGTGVSGVTLDPSQGNLYKIQYKGDFGAVKFYIQDPNDGLWILVHVIQHPNSTIYSTLLSPHLYLYASVFNTSTATSPVTLTISSMSAFIEGSVDTSFAGRNCVTNNLATGTNITNTTTRNILTIQNNSMYQLKPNHILVYPDQLSVYVEPNSGSNNTEFIIVRLYRNPIVGGSSSFTEVANPNANISVVSLDTSGTTVTGGSKVATFYIYSRGFDNNNRQRGPDGNLVVNLSDYNIWLSPGDRLVVTGELTNNGNVNVRASLSWKEQH